MKKIIALLIALMMLASALTACGGDDEKGKASDKGTKETTTADTTEKVKDTGDKEEETLETSIVPPEKT